MVSVVSGFGSLDEHRGCQTTTIMREDAVVCHGIQCWAWRAKVIWAGWDILRECFWVCESSRHVRDEGARRRNANRVGKGIPCQGEQFWPDGAVTLAVPA